MTKLVSLVTGPPEYNWFATSGLFEWVVEFLRGRVDDPQARKHMYNESMAGYIFFDNLPPDARDQALQALREDLIPAVDEDLYPPPVPDDKQIFVARVKNLARMAWRLAVERAPAGTPMVTVSDELTATVSPESMPTVAAMAGMTYEESGRLDLRPLGRSVLERLRNDAAAVIGDGDGRVLAQMAAEALTSSSA